MQEEDIRNWTAPLKPVAHSTTAVTIEIGLSVKIKPLKYKIVISRWEFIQSFSEVLHIKVQLCIYIPAF